VLTKLKINENLTVITGKLHEEVCSFMIISCSVLLTINVSDKCFCENQNTHFIFNIYIQDNVEKYSFARQVADDSAVFGQVIQ
jgi:hypothetical protein